MIISLQIHVTDPLLLGACTITEYDKVKSLPSNFIAIGDATMIVNPLYGQGCGKVMIGLLLLDQMLRKTAPRQFSPTFGQEFFKGLKVRTAGLWDTSKFAGASYSLCARAIYPDVISS